MIIIDLNQIVIAALMPHLTSKKHKVVLTDDLVRHFILDSLRSNIKKFKQSYGSAVIATDGRNYWRKEIFPYYKSHRKADREKSPVDWTTIFNAISKVRDELKEYFPHKIIHLDRAEADDIIAVLVEKMSPTEDILIVSSDEDFLQLQKFKGVAQYSPIMKRFLQTNNPQLFLKEHILRGERGDGIPNFLSADHTLALKERQKRLNTEKVGVWVTQEPADFCTEDMLRNYKRNQMLIDFDYIPGDIKESILKEFANANKNPRMKMVEYCAKYNLRDLASKIDEF